jgi:hypothetical protein
LTDVLVAVALFVAGKTAAVAIAAALQQGDRPAFKGYLTYSFAGVSTLLVTFLAGYWFLLQVSYVKWMPPNHYAFLKMLSKEPYRGASFILNNYAAPVAAYTGQWAYLDTVISHGYVERSGDAFHIAANRSYLWFADRDRNADYLRPEYYLCMLPQLPHTVVSRLSEERGKLVGGLGCSQLGILRLARSNSGREFGLELVDYDRKGLETIGFDSWAIIKLSSGNPERRLVLDWELEVPSRAELVR